MAKQLFPVPQSARLFQQPSTITNSDFDVTSSNIPVAVRNDPTYGTYRKYADGTTQGRVLRSALLRSAGIALTTGTAANIVSLTIPRGRWEISGSIFHLAGATTTISALRSIVSLTSATDAAGDTTSVPSDAGEIRCLLAGLATGGNASLHIPEYEVTVSEDTVFYLVAMDSFGVSTMTVNGYLQAISIV